MEFLQRHLPRVYQAVQDAMNFFTNFTAQVFGAPPNAPQPRNGGTNVPIQKESEGPTAPEETRGKKETDLLTSTPELLGVTEENGDSAGVHPGKDAMPAKSEHFPLSTGARALQCFQVYLYINIYSFPEDLSDEFPEANFPTYLPALMTRGFNSLLSHYEVCERYNTSGKVSQMKGIRPKGLLEDLSDEIPEPNFPTGPTSVMNSMKNKTPMGKSANCPYLKCYLWIE
ncbi:uncharacterized protein LOC120944341 [Rana temporaria]|uniref:uncharacterized protein LOC120944341 n=1 Tax=Rana temporaria TaxID=8407 RepID=UPI001AAD880C|nr:uncharacterized protein LOC120944341 [Rana temporaria]